MRNRRFPAALTMAAGAALVGCSDPAPPPPLPPLIVGAPPATPTGHIDTNQPLDSYTDYVAWDNWPSACDLLTDQDITSIFPQTTSSTRTSHRAARITPVPPNTCAVGSRCRSVDSSTPCWRSCPRRDGGLSL